MKRLKNVKPSTSLYGIFSTIGQPNTRLPSGAKSSAMSAGGLPKVSLKPYKGKAQKKAELMGDPTLSILNWRKR